jgi:hypothetical protein
VAVRGIVEDSRAVDPVAYIRALGLRPEDSYGFLPLNVDEAASFFFLYRDRPEYEQARQKLPEAQSVATVDFGPAGFGIGGSRRRADVDMAAEAPGGRVGDLIAQAQAMQQAYGATAPGAPGEPEAARIAQLEALRDSGVIDEAGYQELLYGVQGGHAGPSPGGAPAAAAPPGAPQIAVHRLYPRLYKRSTSDQFDSFIVGYRDALGLCPEDVYGVWPRHTRTQASGEHSATTASAWEDYWLVYRDRPEYAEGRATWAAAMNEKGGWTERIFSSTMKGRWPEAELVPGVAEAGSVGFDGAAVEVAEEGWPREFVFLREKGPDLGDALRRKLDGWGFGPEDSYGLCPDFNSNHIFFAWRRR